MSGTASEDRSKQKRENVTQIDDEFAYGRPFDSIAMPPASDDETSERVKAAAAEFPESGEHNAGEETRHQTSSDFESIPSQIEDILAALDHMRNSAAKEEDQPAAEEEELDEFAQSVAAGLQQVEIELNGASNEEEHSGHPARHIDDAPAEDEEDHPQEQSAEGELLVETYFAGWDGIELPSEEEDHPGEAGFNGVNGSLNGSYPSDFGNAHGMNGTHHPADNLTLAGLHAESLEEEDYTRKHDALADAVEQALLSVYGNANREGAPLRFSPAGTESTVASLAPDPTAGMNPSLSPQEVIYGYFDYDPRRNPELREAPDDERPYHDRSPSREWDGVAPPQRRPAPPLSPAPAPRAPLPNSRLRSDGGASFAVPAPALDRPTAKESSRLLGAAALGLVAGIAVAVALAVFAFNVFDNNATQPGEGPQIEGNETAGLSEGGTRDNLAEEWRQLSKGQFDDGYRVQPQRSPESVASLTINDLTATPGQAVPLPLTIRSSTALDQMLVSISGLPEGTRLNAGVDVGGGGWLVPPARVPGLLMTIPATAIGDVSAEVQIVDANLRAPLSEKRNFAIRVNAPAAQPVAETKPKQDAPKAALAALPGFSTETLPSSEEKVAPNKNAAPQDRDAGGFSTQTVGLQQAADKPAKPIDLPKPVEKKAAQSQQPVQAVQQPIQQPAQQEPAQQTASIQTLKQAPQAEIDDLIREGNKRMREGDILQAREFYVKAAAYGDPEAALAMGRSYDPIYFAKMERWNAQPDAAKAFEWYRKAMEGGSSQTAKVRIENLKHYLNE